MNEELTEVIVPNYSSRRFVQQSHRSALHPMAKAPRGAVLRIWLDFSIVQQDNEMCLADHVLMGDVQS
jgi:hypothetical protein